MNRWLWDVCLTTTDSLIHSHSNYQYQSLTQGCLTTHTQKAAWIASHECHTHHHRTASGHHSTIRRSLFAEHMVSWSLVHLLLYPAGKCRDVRCLQTAAVPQVQCYTLCCVILKCKTNHWDHNEQIKKKKKKEKEEKKNHAFSPLL